MKLLQILSLSLILSVIATSLNAQKDIRKADKQLELKVYDLAIKNYKSYLDANPENTYAQLKLAEAYRRTNELMKAVYWYEKSVSVSDSDVNDILNYAECLKKLGLYEKAKKVYTEIRDVRKIDVSEEFIAGCQSAIDILKAEDDYDISPYDGNSPNSDFGAYAVGNDIVFSSFRTDLKRKDGKKNVSYIQQVGNELFVAPNKESVDVSEIKFVQDELNALSSVGPIAYNPSSKTVALTKNNFSDGAVAVVGYESDMSLYIANMNGAHSFSNVQALPFNQVEYSYAFPHLTFDGSALYFSSNQPGGLGGFDLYVSYFKDNQWSTPQNLGPEVNSDANEITPFFYNDELYFSSDDIYGLGGFDVYKSSIQDGQWEKSENLGKGINSPADDYYLSVTAKDEFCFTSNRLGGRGKDDIYFGSKRISLADEIFAQEEVPAPVNLDELALAKQEVIKDAPQKVNEVSVVSESDEMVKVTTSEEPDMFDAAGEFKLYDHYELDLSGAVKKGTEPERERFFIQIASLKKSQGDLDDFNNLVQYGKLYRFVLSNSTKIRLGAFDQEADASRVLSQVKNLGYQDAFITTATLADKNIELIGGNGFVDYMSNEGYTGPQYKVRLASYSDATWFDTAELDYLDGDLEQWTKGYWHIFILSGFNSLEEAEAARIKAVNRGFKEAEVVVDEKGTLKRLNRH